VAIRRRGDQARQHPTHRSQEFLADGDPHVPFEQLVEEALDTLPESVLPLLDNVAIVIEDEPSEEQLDRSRVPIGGTLYGLYEGVSPVVFGADHAPFPNKITIFRLPLEEDFPHPTQLKQQVRATVLHEIGHHAGLDHTRLRKASYR
jgi:predicted Zn-dependent protease with MMP-like domain